MFHRSSNKQFETDFNKLYEHSPSFLTKYGIVFLFFLLATISGTIYLLPNSINRSPLYLIHRDTLWKISVPENRFVQFLIAQDSSYIHKGQLIGILNRSSNQEHAPLISPTSGIIHLNNTGRSSNQDIYIKSYVFGFAGDIPKKTVANYKKNLGVRAEIKSADSTIIVNCRIENIYHKSDNDSIVLRSNSDLNFILEFKKEPNISLLMPESTLGFIRSILFDHRAFSTFNTIKKR